MAGLPDAAEEDIDQSQVSWNMGGGTARAASPAMKRYYAEPLEHGQHDPDLQVVDSRMLHMNLWNTVKDSHPEPIAKFGWRGELLGFEG